jgi:hypothetical protein
MRQRKRNGKSNFMKNVTKPPQIQSNVRVQNLVLRFRTESAGETAIDSDQVLRACGLVILTAASAKLEPEKQHEGWIKVGPTPRVDGQAYTIANSYKIRYIEAWASPSSDAGACELSLDWYTRESTKFMTSVSDSGFVGQVAHIKARPPPTCGAAFWNSNSSDNIFKIHYPAGAIFDIGIQWVLRDIGVVGLSTAISSANTPGTIGYPSLDAADNIIPVGRETLALVTYS